MPYLLRVHNFALAHLRIAGKYPRPGHQRLLAATQYLSDPELKQGPLYHLDEQTRLMVDNLQLMLGVIQLAKGRRHEARLTLALLCARTGLARETLEAIESGDLKSSVADNLIYLAALGGSLKYEESIQRAGNPLTQAIDPIIF